MQHEARFNFALYIQAKGESLLGKQSLLLGVLRGRPVSLGPTICLKPPFVFDF